MTENVVSEVAELAFYMGTRPSRPGECWRRLWNSPTSAASRDVPQAEPSGEQVRALRFRGLASAPGSLDPGSAPPCPARPSLKLRGHRVREGHGPCGDGPRRHHAQSRTTYWPWLSLEAPCATRIERRLRTDSEGVTRRKGRGDLPRSRPRPASGPVHRSLCALGWTN